MINRIRQYVLSLLIVVSTFLGNSSNVDSLLQITTQNIQDTVKVRAYEQLALSFRKNNPDSAFFFNSEAIRLAKSIEDYSWLAEAYREYALTAQAKGDYPLTLEYYRYSKEVYQKNGDSLKVGGGFNDIGIAHYYAGDYDSARFNFERAGELKIMMGDSSGAGRAFNNTGIMHDIAGNPMEAVKLYLKALNIYENIKDTSLMLGTLSNIGLIYQGQKNHQEALNTYARIKVLATMINATKTFGIALSSEAVAYDELGEYDTARSRLYAALEIFKELNDKPLLGQCYSNLSTNFSLTKAYEKSLEYALKSIQIKEEIGSKGRMAVSQNAAGKAYLMLGDIKEAKRYYSLALKNSKATGYLEYTVEAHEGLAEIYRQNKQYEKAFFHMAEYSTLKDSIVNENNANLIADMEKKYQSDRKQQEIELLNKTHELKDVELAKSEETNRRKSLQLYGSMGLGLVLLVLVSVIFRSNQQRKRSNIALTQKNVEITKQKEIVEEQHKEITDSINYAKRIQTALLTSDEYWNVISPEHFVLFKPKDVVSGDFFWAYQTEQNLAVWVAADCTGHGVPGAFMSMLGIGFLNEIIVENGVTHAPEILNQLRAKIINALEQKGVETQQKDGMDLALCVWNKQNDMLSFSGANNPLWLVRNSKHVTAEMAEFSKMKIGDLELLEFKADKQPVGSYTEEVKSFTAKEIQLVKGDVVYTFSDGFADQFGGEKGKKYKYKTFKNKLIQICDEPLAKQKQILDEEFEAWRGELEQIDDVCVVGVRI